MAQEESQFKSLACSKGLNEETIQALQSQEIDSVLLLQLLTRQDIDIDSKSGLSLDADQREALLKWMEELNQDIPQIKDEETRLKADYDKCFTVLKKARTFRDELVLEFDEFGCKNLPNKLMEKLKTYRNLDQINVAIMGELGVGKSNLINTLRGLKAKDPGAAKVSVSTSTTDLTPYPLEKNLILWDVPALTETPLWLFDGIIICIGNRFMETDLKLAKTAADLKLPSLCVRMKLDLDIKSTREKLGAAFVEKDEIQRIKDDVKSKLSDNGLPAENVYALSSNLDYKSMWDFPQFLDDLSSPEFARKCVATVQTVLISSSEDSIRKLKSKLSGMAERLADEITNSSSKSCKDAQYLQDTLENEANVYYQKFHGQSKPEYEARRLNVRSPDSSDEPWYRRLWKWFVITCGCYGNSIRTEPVMFSERDMDTLMDKHMNTFGWCSSAEEQKAMKTIRKNNIMSGLNQYIDALANGALKQLTNVIY